jgi:hypothetical protein
MAFEHRGQGLTCRGEVNGQGVFHPKSGPALNTAIGTFLNSWTSFARWSTRA